MTRQSKEEVAADWLGASDRRIRELEAREAEARAILADWLAVGNDMRKRADIRARARAYLMRQP